MSSRKKNLNIECPNCICYISTKDLNVHKEECPGNTSCNSFLLTSSVSIIVPFVGMVAKNQDLGNATSFLPPDLIGWEKWNVVLMHSETMSRLHILPREPCLVTEISNGSNVSIPSVKTVWPCNQVKEMQICVRRARSGARFRINVVNRENIKKVSVVQLRLLSGKHFLPVYTKKHFRYYAKTYLSNSFLGIGLPVYIHYYGQEHTFDLILSDEENFGMLKISSDIKMPALIKPSPDCVYYIVNNTATLNWHPLTFADFGGAKNVKAEIEQQLINPLKVGKKACSVIIYGDTGCGKSLLLRIIQESLQNLAVQLSREEFEDFIETGCGKSDGRMAVLVDDFDDLTHFTSKFCWFMDRNVDFVFVLAVRNVESIVLPLRRRFSCELQLPVPSVTERKEILQLLFKQGKLDYSFNGKLIEDVALKTHGYTGSDLKIVCERVFADLVSTADVETLSNRFDSVLKRVLPTGIRQFVLEVPNVSWEDIGGNRELKMEIEEAILWPYRYPELFERFATKPPSGILLYGPPGCSKTLIARAIASQSRMNFLAVKGPELFNKWVGESERAVRELFRRARQVAPAIIFFDEIDGMGANRGNGSESRVGDRVLAQLLTELDGLEKKVGVMVLAATNRPDRLDSALLRPGRFDLKIHVPLPDEETRYEIMRIRLSRMTVTVDSDLKDISKKTEGFSGAEMVLLCDQAARRAMLENREADKLETRHFYKALEKIVPRTDRSLLDINMKFEKGVF